MRYFKHLFILSFMLLVLVGCKTPTYTVSFVTDAEDVDPVPVEENQAVQLPTIEKEGYNLIGWFFDADFTNPYDDEGITQDTTLYAKWEIKTFTVKFMNGNIELKTQTVNYGEDATAPDEPEKLGYTFKKWSVAFTDVKSNLTVVAEFERQTFEVVFMNGDTQIGETQTVNFGENATPPADPEKEGFVFTGWDKSFLNVQADLVINAKFDPLTYEVIFKDFDGTQLGDTQTVNWGDDAVAPADPSHEGYTFDGWDKEFTDVKANLVVTAKFKTVDYSIEYFDGDTKLEHTPNTYTVAATVNLTEFEKEGFLFVGWFLNEDFSDETIIKIPAGSTGSKVFYGKWLDETDLLTVQYEINDGSWTWISNPVEDAEDGIDAFSDLPEIFMQDFYTYLKENNLLTSSKVAASLQKTNWTDFSKNYTDPVAIYNNTTTNTSSANDGYSQLFYETATGNTETGELYDLQGGFLGTEPYKTKYFQLIKLVTLLANEKYTIHFFEGASGKTLFGFVLDGYFYGTQGLGGQTSLFVALRHVIPTATVGYTFDGSKAVSYDTDYDYPLTSYINGLPGQLSLPSRVGYAFGGWYAAADFSGDRVVIIPKDTDPAEKYYAKWVALE